MSGCWNVDGGSEAASVTVTVAFELDREGRVAGPVRLVEASEGSAQAQEAAFQAARRAIVRCDTQNDGYDLPPEKHERWRDNIMSFNPEGMRIR